MTRLPQLTLALTVCFLFACGFLIADDTEEGFVSIFNGENMDGWVGAVGGEGYQAEDRMLVCVEGGNIYTEKDYDDFIYRLDFRIPEGANNGVGIRVPEGGHASSQGMEIQILDDYAEKFANLKSWQFTGAVYGIVPPKRDFLKEAGQWNTMEIHCEGRDIRITLNDEVVVDANLDEHLPPMDGYDRPGAERSSGRLSFCGHGARIEYRNLRVKELSIQTPLEEAELYAYAVRRPIPLDACKIDDDFWSPHIEASQDVGTLDYLQKMDDAGYIRNFEIVAQQLLERHSGGPNNNEFVYKLMEAAAYYANENSEVRDEFASLFDLVLAAQDDDGYLNTFYDNPLVQAAGNNPRFSTTGRFEFYDFGHFTQAAIAWNRTTGDDQPLQGAIRFADLIVEQFGAPNKLPYQTWPGIAHKKYEHPNHELAMVELYRETGDRRYLEFAKHTLDQYEFWNFEEIYGHAVQETLLLAGAADVYLEYGEPEMWTTLDRLWHDMRDRKMYVTGGVGSTGRSEAYGEAYNLPNRTSYSETCAAIANVFWNHKMLLATGEAKYADVIERALYNNVLSGYSLSGTEYFYQNCLESVEGRNRRPFYGCSCCPPNVHRLLGSLQQYIYTTAEDGVSVDLYIGSELATKIHNIPVHIRQSSAYRFGGIHRINVDPENECEFTLRVRRPEWVNSTGDENGGGPLYQFIDQLDFSPRLMVNGEPVALDANEKGYYAIERLWRQGDIVDIEFPVPVRLVSCRSEVEANRGRFAFQCGPFIYCVEGIDNEGNVLNLRVNSDAKQKVTFRKDLLGGVSVIEGDAIALFEEGNGEIREESFRYMAVPYALWANREQGAMTVWLPASQEAAVPRKDVSKDAQ